MCSKITSTTSTRNVVPDINTKQAKPALLYENPDSVAKKLQETAKKLGVDLKNPQFTKQQATKRPRLLEASAETIADGIKNTAKKIGSEIKPFLKAALKK